MDEQKVLVILAEGFEEVEAITVIDLLRRAEINVKSVALGDELAVTGAHGITVMADKTFADEDFESVAMMVLPGGMVGTDNMLADSALCFRLKQFATAGIPIAAICAAPRVLAALGLLNGLRATIYEGMEAELTGATPWEGNVVIHGDMITSKGPGTAMDFALAIIAHLRGGINAREVAEGLLYQMQ